MKGIFSQTSKSLKMLWTWYSGFPLVFFVIISGPEKGGILFFAKSGYIWNEKEEWE